MSALGKSKARYVRLLPEDQVPAKLRGLYRSACRELSPNGIYRVDASALREALRDDGGVNEGDLYLGMSFHDVRLFEVL